MTSSVSNGRCFAVLPRTCFIVVPSERSDREASPKGARDLPLVRTPSSPRSFGPNTGLRMTTLCPPEDLFFCRPEQRDREASPKGARDLHLILGCLKREILRPYPRPQDDKQHPFVPNERSDRGASPKGVRDLGVDSGLSQERDPSPPGTRSAMEPPSG